INRKVLPERGEIHHKGLVSAAEPQPKGRNLKSGEWVTVLAPTQKILCRTTNHVKHLPVSHKQGDRPKNLKFWVFLRVLCAFVVKFARFSDRPTEFFEAIHPFFDHVETRSVAETDSAIFPESDARNDRDVCFAQESVREILGGQPESTDV